MPVPLSVTVCVADCPLSVTVSVAVSLPLVVGENVTLIKHVPLGPFTVPLFTQVVPEATAKSAALAPVMVTALDDASVKVELAMFVSVTIIAALVVPLR